MMAGKHITCCWACFPPIWNGSFSAFGKLPNWWHLWLLLVKNLSQIWLCFTHLWGEALTLLCLPHCWHINSSCSSHDSVPIRPCSHMVLAKYTSSRWLSVCIACSGQANSLTTQQCVCINGFILEDWMCHSFVCHSFKILDFDQN